MIRLNCFFHANAESETAYKDALRAAVALTEKSRKHAGCIAYAEVSPLSGETAFRRKGPSMWNPLSRFIGRRSVCETWKDDASFKAHAETPELLKV